MMSRKIMILGEIGVGKTSLVRRFVLDELPTDYMPTMGVDIYRYTVPAAPPGQLVPVELVIWDIDGNYGQSIFRHVYSKGASGALIVGDITRRPTLELMVELAHGFQDALPGRHFSFVINKLDLVANPDEADIPDALRQTRQPMVWSSARTGNNVRRSFEMAAAAISRRES